MLGTVDIYKNDTSGLIFIYSTINGPNMDPLLSVQAKSITVIVNYILICGTIAFMGIIGNITNLVIFSKLGYDNTMNISLSGLAVSDICTLLFMTWWNVCLNPLFMTPDHVILSSEVQYLTAGWPHNLFARITCIITTFITMERCLCVAMPLKVKSIITKYRTLIVIAFIFISQLTTNIPSYYMNYFDWKFFPEINRSLIGMYRRDHWESIEGVSFVLQSTMQALSFVLLIFFTILLLVSLERKKQWRKTSTSNTQHNTISTRDSKIVRMVILIALILIVCFTPGMICFSAMAFESEYTMGGYFDSVFYVSWSLPVVCQTFNSSVNILIYHKMSSKYRDAFNEYLIWFMSCVRVIRKQISKFKVQKEDYHHCTPDISKSPLQ